MATTRWVAVRVEGSQRRYAINPSGDLARYMGQAHRFSTKAEAEKVYSGFNEGERALWGTQAVTN